MGKESKSGTSFYTDKGMVTITVGIPKKIHAKLLKHARRSPRGSLQKVARRAITEFAKRI